VDIYHELRNMRGWLLGNPKKRKTKGGIGRFIHAWLGKEQDKGGNARASPTSIQPGRTEELIAIAKARQGERHANPG